MADTHDDTASEAGRVLIARRWGSPSPVLARAVSVLRDRRDELDGPLKAELREIAGDPDGDDAR